MQGQFVAAATIFLFWIMPIAANMLPGRYEPRAEDGQKPLLQDTLGFSPLPTTTTYHSTETLYHFSMATTTRTRYLTDSSTNVPHAVQTWYAGQRQACYDLTACASCRSWYRCWGTHSLWWAPLPNGLMALLTHF